MIVADPRHLDESLGYQLDSSLTSPKDNYSKMMTSIANALNPVSAQGARWQETVAWMIGFSFLVTTADTIQDYIAVETRNVHDVPQ